MKKKAASGIPEAKAALQSDDLSWHNGGDIEIGFYARSLLKAAKTLIATLDLEPTQRRRGMLARSSCCTARPLNFT